MSDTHGKTEAADQVVHKDESQLRQKRMIAEHYTRLANSREAGEKKGGPAPRGMDGFAMEVTGGVLIEAWGLDYGDPRENIIEPSVVAAGAAAYP